MFQPVIMSKRVKLVTLRFSKMEAVQNFWDKADTEELLKMSESDIAHEFKKIAAEYRISNVIITIHDSVYITSLNSFP